MSVDKYHDRLVNELPVFAAKCLKIEDKLGQLQSFVFNDAQRYLHERLEDQYKRKGYIRALIVKGRQQGCSTYVAGRFYHKCIFQDGSKAFVLSHLSDTTDELFKKITVFQEHIPPYFKHQTTTDNRRSLALANRAEYRTGTSKSKSGGRGSTARYFHGSECAYYENPDELKSGIFQSIAKAPGTEIILESTANGKTGLFHDYVMKARKGENDYEVIFIPWYWQQEYRLPVDNYFEKTLEEEELALLYDLDDEQINWRRDKILELESERLFKQEYPCTIDEAFQSSGEQFFSPESIEVARKRDVIDRLAPLVLGVDVGAENGRTAISFRRGREFATCKVFKHLKQRYEDEMELAGRLAGYIESYKPVKVFIDKGYGRGVADQLKALGYGPLVATVGFGESSPDDRFLNMRAYMYWEARKWLNDDVCIPDDDQLIADLNSIPVEKSTGTAKIKLVSKDEIKKALGMSPDLADSFVLTFAFPVASKEIVHEHRADRMKKRPSAFKTLQRKRGQGKNKTLRREWRGL